MFQNKRIIAFIPARGGSKGIPHKNIIDLCGKPLIDYTIQAGLKSKYIDYVMVSTDDTEIAKISERCGACIPFMRPASLATDKSRINDAIVYSIQKLHEMGKKFDTLVLLQPTQPLRTADDIDQAFSMYMANNCTPLASVNPVDDHPILIRTIKNNSLVRLLNEQSTVRRQDMPCYYRINGCIYINEINTINLETSFNDNPIPFIMDKSHSVDIDEISDLAMARYYLSLETQKKS